MLDQSNATGALVALPSESTPPIQAESWDGSLPAPALRMPIMCVPALSRKPTTQHFSPSEKPDATPVKTPSGVGSALMVKRQDEANTWSKVRSMGLVQKMG